jgi:SAM-dependent methyltransferase
MRRVDYETQQHQVYAQGRAITPERMDSLMSAFAAQLPAARPLRIVDVGSGVGRFTPALADTFGGPVFGIEPAQSMRRQAELLSPHPRVEYHAGRAEDLPLLAATCDAALLWFVWHHIEDRARAAKELARVVRKGGTVLLRTNAADRMPDQWWFEHFPKARDVETERSNTHAEIVALFEEAGWKLEKVAIVEVVSTYGRDLEMLRLKAISTLEHLTPGEYLTGLHAASGAVAGRKETQVTSPGDLFVFRS